MYIQIGVYERIAKERMQLSCITKMSTGLCEACGRAVCLLQALKEKIKINNIMQYNTI